MFDKSKPNPLADAARKIMESNAKDRQVIAELNQKLGIQDRRQLPNEKLASYDKLLGETLAKPSMLKEENLQELSKDTLKSYVKSAQREVDAVEKFQGAFPKDRQKLLMKVFNNNKEGIVRAKAKLNEAKTPSYEAILAEVRKNLGEDALSGLMKNQAAKTPVTANPTFNNTMAPAPVVAAAPVAPAPIKPATTSLSLPGGKTLTTSGAATSALQAPTNTNTVGNPTADKAAAAPTAAKIDANPDVIKAKNANALAKTNAIKADNDPRAETTDAQQRASFTRARTPDFTSKTDTAAAERNAAKVDKADIGLATPTPKAEPAKAEFKFNSKGGKVSAAELEAYRKHTGKNVSLGQYMNARDGKTAVKGGKNDFTPDPYLKEEKKPYRTMTSIVESIQNKDYLNESNT